MPIDNSSCINAINHLKSYVTACFNKCTAKGSTFTGEQKLANLETAIDLIPTGSGGGDSPVISENINGESFDLFTVTKSTDVISPNEFTIDFGSVGVTWRSIVCYSDTKDGHFSIHKISGNKCIISASIFYNSENMWDESTGIFPDVRGTYRATYEISGSTIHFTNAEYDATSNGSDSYDDFASMPNQVSNAENSYFTDQYKLDKIIVCV